MPAVLCGLVQADRLSALPVLAVRDAKPAVHRMYGARVIPTVIVIDPNGVIGAYYAGERGEKDLVAAVKTAGLK
jgi:hypothetical protein